MIVSMMIEEGAGKETANTAAAAAAPKTLLGTKVAITAILLVKTETTVTKKIVVIDGPLLLKVAIVNIITESKIKQIIKKFIVVQIRPIPEIKSAIGGILEKKSNEERMTPVAKTKRLLRMYIPTLKRRQLQT